MRWSLAGVELVDGAEITPHGPIPGYMIGCSTLGSQNTKRKLVYTLQTVEQAGTLINVHTCLSNACTEEAILAQTIPEQADYASQRREVKHGESSRLDILLADPERGRCYVEVKSATMEQDSTALFPGAVSARALKHLDELTRVAEGADRGVILFISRA